MAERFLARIDRLAAAGDAEGWPADVRRLEGRARTFRLRVGSYRGVFEITDDGILFTRFDHRSRVYRP